MAFEYCCHLNNRAESRPVPARIDLFWPSWIVQTDGWIGSDAAFNSVAMTGRQNLGRMGALASIRVPGTRHCQRKGRHEAKNRRGGPDVQLAEHRDNPVTQKQEVSEHYRKGSPARPQLRPAGGAALRGAPTQITWFLRPTSAPTSFGIAGPELWTAGKSQLHGKGGSPDGVSIKPVVQTSEKVDTVIGIPLAKRRARRFYRFSLALRHLHKVVHPPYTVRRVSKKGKAKPLN